MSTIFDIRKLRLPQLSKAAVVIGSLVVAVGLVAGVVGWQLYEKLTNNTVVAYFPAVNALYTGDKVQIMGIRVGAIDKIEPTGDRMKVTFHYRNKYKVPANASAVVLNPTLVASRSIQLEPPYKGGPVLADSAVIPIERTQVPVEWDELRNSVTHIIDKLGPSKDQPKGPFGDVIEAFANGLDGKGQQINTTLNSLSNALSTLDEGRGDFFAVLKKPGDVRQRAAPGRSAVRRAEQGPGTADRQPHQLGSVCRQRHSSTPTACCPPLRNS